MRAADYHVALDAVENEQVDLSGLLDVRGRVHRVEPGGTTSATSPRLCFPVYSVPAGPEGAEMRFDVFDRSTGRTDIVRILEGGRVVTWDRGRRRHVEAPMPWRTIADAQRIGIELLVTLTMIEDAEREIAARERDRARGYTRDQAGDREQAQTIKRRLDDPQTVVQRLGLAEGARRQRKGLFVKCPAHADRSPSCSVRVAEDGTIWAHCMACRWSGDVFALVAAVHHLDVRRDFRAVLELAADLAGVQLVRRAS